MRCHALYPRPRRCRQHGEEDEQRALEPGIANFGSTFSKDGGGGGGGAPRLAGGRGACGRATHPYWGPGLTSLGLPSRLVQLRRVFVAWLARSLPFPTRLARFCLCSLCACTAIVPDGAAAVCQRLFSPSPRLDLDQVQQPTLVLVLVTFASQSSSSLSLRADSTLYVALPALNFASGRRNRTHCTAARPRTPCSIDASLRHVGLTVTPKDERTLRGQRPQKAQRTDL